MQCFECANVRDAKEWNNTRGLSYLLYKVGRGRCLVIYLKLDQLYTGWIETEWIMEHLMGLSVNRMCIHTVINSSWTDACT